MSGQLFYLPNARQLSITGALMNGWTLNFFVSETSTPAPVYSDASLETSLGPVVTAESDGHMPAIYLDPAVTYRVQVKNAAGVLQPAGDVDPINAPNGVQSIVAGDGVSIDDTDPLNPIVSADGGESSIKFVLANVQADGNTFGNPLNVDNITVEGDPNFNIYFIEFDSIGFANIPTVTANTIGAGRAVINDLADPDFCRIVTYNDAGDPEALPFSLQVIGQ